MTNKQLSQNDNHDNNDKVSITGESKTNSKTKVQDWEEEFDNKFILADSLGREHCPLKDFIKKQITTAHNYAIDEAIKNVKEMKIKGDFYPKKIRELLGIATSDNLYESGIQNEVIQEVIEKLEKLKN